MDKKPKEKLLGRANVVLDVWYYCYAYVVHVVHVTSMMCALVVLCIHSMCICYLCNVMYMMVQIGLCEYCILGVVYILYCLPDIYASCVHMVLCAYWICSVVYS